MPKDLRSYLDELRARDAADPESRLIVDGSLDRALEYEKAYESMERREAVWIATRERGDEPRLPPKHVPAGGQVIRE